MVNASPDSLHTESVVTSRVEAARRAEWLVDNGAWGFDVGGQGSTYAAGQTTVDQEWARLEPILPVLVAYEMPVSIDTWRPETARRAFDLGVTWLNAAEGLQDPAMLAVAAEHDCPVVLPFLSGPDPLNMDLIRSDDPVSVLLGFFDEAVQRAQSVGIEGNLVLDPGTGFAPHGWPWQQRYEYQKKVYSQLQRLEVYRLPLYIALPWKETAQHDELLDIVIQAGPEYGRCHHPDRINLVIDRLARDREA